MRLTRSRVVTGVSAILGVAITAVMLTVGGDVTLAPESQIIIGPQAAMTSSWFDTTQIQQAKLHAQGCVDPPPTDNAGLNTFILNQYYDLTMTAYIAAKRANDPELLALARKCADSWWKHPTWIGEGRIQLFPDQATPSPRHAGIGGLILRALDGRPEMWPWITAYTRAALDNWVLNRMGTTQLFYGLREGAFALHYAAWVAGTHPDPAVRARFVADIENAVVNYFGKHQLADGSWRWDTATDEFVEDDGGTLKGVMQPFMVGLTVSALIDAHQVIGNPTAKESAKQQILKACRHLYEGGPYIKDQVEVKSGRRIRGFHYYYHGGTSVNPTRYEKGDIPNPWTAAEEWYVPSARQAISTIVGAYGYAFLLSGDPFYKIAGDELWDAAYGGGDGIRAMADTTAKNYSQHYRFAGRYLVWRGGGALPTPSATSTPIASVSPTPLPTPVVSPTTIVPSSPNPTKAEKIVDSLGGEWSFDSERRTLRNGIHMGQGYGVMYKWLDNTVYVMTTDNRTWYRWAGGWVELGWQEPGGALPTPTPTATSTPTPQPTPTVQPTATPTPSPSASPSPLPYCRSGERPSPTRCRCRSGVRQNGKCW